MGEGVQKTFFDLPEDDDGGTEDLAERVADQAVESYPLQNC